METNFGGTRCRGFRQVEKDEYEEEDERHEANN